MLERIKMKDKITKIVKFELNFEMKDKITKIVKFELNGVLFDTEEDAIRYAKESKIARVIKNIEDIISDDRDDCTKSTDIMKLISKLTNNELELIRKDLRGIEL